MTKENKSAAQNNLPRWMILVLLSAAVGVFAGALIAGDVVTLVVTGAVFAYGVYHIWKGWA